MFEYALCTGLMASGADAYIMHVTTTPSVAYITRVDDFDCGIMISASHNPFYDNGIKLLNSYGEKMDEETILKVEAYIDGEVKIPLATGEEIGRTVDYVSGRNRYIGYLISMSKFSFKDKKVGLDVANGAAWSIAKGVFDALGAKTYVINAEPDGTNINTDCGSTHIEHLQKFVVEKGLDVGFAYDGDADRCLCVDEKGNVITGDHILYIYGLYMKERDKLINNTIFLKLLENADMKQKFLERLAYVYRTLTPQVMNDKLTEIKAILEPEMPMHFERWAPLNDKKINSDSPLSKDGALGYWNTRINRMRDTINRRHHFLWGYIKEAFGLSNAQMLELFGEQPADPLAKK